MAPPAPASIRLKLDWVIMGFHGLRWAVPKLTTFLCILAIAHLLTTHVQVCKGFKSCLPHFECFHSHLAPYNASKLLNDSHFINWLLEFLFSKHNMTKSTPQRTILTEKISAKGRSAILLSDLVFFYFIEK